MHYHGHIKTNNHGFKIPSQDKTDRDGNDTVIYNIRKAVFCHIESDPFLRLSHFYGCFIILQTPFAVSVQTYHGQNNVKNNEGININCNIDGVLSVSINIGIFLPEPNKGSHKNGSDKKHYSGINSYCDGFCDDIRNEEMSEVSFG